jgi:polyketide biosynthesis enoyl-CoA hydratase PksH
MDLMSHHTIKVRWQDACCFLQLHRPDAQNSIDERMIDECSEVLAACRISANVVVLEGTRDVFCSGADLRSPSSSPLVAQRLYDLWLALATGPFVSVAHVEGRANAGGLGFVAACDVVIASDTAQFGLSELLFGLLPACVLPFLARRIGASKAHNLALSTLPISARQAYEWGLVDSVGEKSGTLLRKHLMRVKHIEKDAIEQYKRYALQLDDTLVRSRALAAAKNQEVFSDPRRIAAVHRYLRTGLFPWESEE